MPATDSEQINMPLVPRQGTWFARLGEAVFPSITELQYVTAFAVLGALCLADPTLVGLFFRAVGQNMRFALLPLMPVYLTVVMVKKKQLSEASKLMACFFYFGGFAVLAFIALLHQKTTAGTTWSLENANYWLTNVVLIVAILRGFIAFLAFRFNNRPLRTFVAQNFRDTQYRPTMFLLAATLALGAVLLLKNVYNEDVVVAVLAFTYTNIALAFTCTILQTFTRVNISESSNGSD